MDELARALRALGGGGAGDRSATAAARLADAAAREGLLDVAYATVGSPLGPLLVASTPEGLVTLAYLDGASLDERLDRLARRVSPRVLEAPARLDRERRELEEYFEGRRRAFDLPIDWRLIRGFARSVLERTAAIPFGQARTYTQIAAEAGSPRGSRAAGNALGGNPIPIVIPCHRVLRAGGALGGYTGGLDRKRFLLDLESGGG
ncbi:methylated-DNA--[protein]-cysteine S-methyltransferase [Miltoncostaea marina]|uniref:methylated-DNA--[protein]-cysteine S-methyltransferase n=1 Tax=Miltoncostaea marina TaxID=2843215 RepID=UPI001C3DB6B4|nr:methylated-DNA--[protein]-cysteine S-methyltransferase [Miltoncostaea marina]